MLIFPSLVVNWTLVLVGNLLTHVASDVRLGSLYVKRPSAGFRLVSLSVYLGKGD